VFVGTKINAYYDARYFTIRHSNCDWILSGDVSSERCAVCTHYRDNYLQCKARSILNRTEEMSSSSCSASSHTNYRYLDTPEKLLRMKNLHSLVIKQRKQLNNIMEKLAHSLRTNGVHVQEDMHDDMVQLVQQYSKTADHKSNQDDESFQSIFWKQQLKNLSLKNKKQIRWHPLIIHWALYLHHRSSGAYETLRDSGIITLPSSRTLCDYRHFFSAQTGFSPTADSQLLEIMEQKKSPWLSMSLSLLMKCTSRKDWFMTKVQRYY